MCAFFLSESSRKTRWQNAGRKIVFEQGLKMWSVFLKIAEIRWDRRLRFLKTSVLFTEKLTLFTEKLLLFIEKSVQKSKKLNTGLRSQETRVG
jgi:hypothetical protein